LDKVITFLFLYTLCRPNSNTLLFTLRIIKLNAIDSTNTYLKKLSKKKQLEDGTIVLAVNQTQGRGQMGAVWQSKAGQSLTFSIFKRFDRLAIAQQSKITFGVSVGIKQALKKLQVPAISIKWPNDIMSYQQKLCGILIENQLEGSAIISSVIGVGLNVNETEFSNLPQATSIKLVTGISFNLEEVLQIISDAVLEQLNKLETTDTKQLKVTYEEWLFRKNKVTVFKDASGTQFNGMIVGVNDMGELIVELDDEVRRAYELKNIKMLY
jgi:BirA family biotin operon repressor/biotin-[acetyl-CoA-carboxylase] ligase